MWMLLIRPQRERVRRRQTVIRSLEIGDEVYSGGGLIGRIVDMRDREIFLEVAPGTVVGVLREGIIDRLPPPVPDDETLPDDEAETE